MDLFPSGPWCSVAVGAVFSDDFVVLSLAAELQRACGSDCGATSGVSFLAVNHYQTISHGKLWLSCNIICI